MTSRVAYVTSHLPFGPGEAFAVPELLALRGLDMDTVIVPVRPSGLVVHPDAARLVGQTRAEGVVSPGVLRGALRSLARNPARSVQAVAAMAIGPRPSVALKNLAVAMKGLWLADLVAREGISHLHAYWASTPATVAFIASRVSGVPMSMTAHSWDIREDNCLASKARHAVLTRVISRDGQAELERLIPEEARSRIRLLHLGVDIPEDPHHPDVRNVLRVAVPAAFVPFKGHAVLVETLRQLAARRVGAEFTLVGSGPLRGSIELAVERAGVKGMVQFAGQVPHDTLLAWYAAGSFDAVILPSVTQPDGSREGIPISLVEAMARGLPVVGTTCGGVPELLEGGAGLIVAEGSADALADAVATLAADPALRTRLGAAARTRAREEFNVLKQTRLLSDAAQFSRAETVVD